MLLAGYEGDFTPSNASSVLFLWKNWHHYFSLANRFISCEANSKLSWEASGLGGSGEWYLTQHQTSPDYGLLHFHNYIHFMGFLFKFQTLFQYARLNNGMIWYCGGGFGSSPTALAVTARPLGSFALGKVGRTGGRVAAKLTKHPGWLNERCGFEARALYEEYVAEEARWHSGNRDSLRYFDGHQLRPIAIYEGLLKDFLSTARHDLVARIHHAANLCPPGYDQTLLNVALLSFDYGVPGASHIALRDFTRQHRLGSLEYLRNEPQLRKRILALARGVGGKLATHMDAREMFEAEVRAVGEAASTLVEVLQQQASR